MEFVARSPKSQKVLNTLRVSANLPVNILVWGEEGTGKRTLVEEVFKDLVPVSVDEVDGALEGELYHIYDLHRCGDPKRLLERLNGKRIIATANDYREVYEELFPIILHLPPLKERPEDLEELTRRYVQEAKRDFQLEDFVWEMEPDLSKNAISLKRSIFTQAVLSSLKEEELMQLLERFLGERLEEGYKQLLYLFEVPLFRAAKRRYRSTLAISKALQLNRATVTNRLLRYKELIE
ncbi:MAG: hypothetical protein C6I00_07640 [Nitratiruptor sp.]|nr:hypothetical protein [Nitratiruptor sp.]NPA82963.1 hypothetical protein [Campylobacterota bacterium]